MRILLAMAILGMAATTLAETLSLPAFQIEVEVGWAHTIEKKSNEQPDRGDLLRIYHPNGNGVLQLQFYSTPGLIGKERLRNMSNVERSTTLSWKKWGDYSGYQHDYVEGNIFYRQWWIANEYGVIIIVYNSDTESLDVEVAEINKIVNSIKTNDG